MINADQWEYLIQWSLPYLKRFHFTFGLYCRGKNRDDIIEKFKQFQTDFWCKQHQWFIEYVYDINSAVIYTVPYVSNAYRLTVYTGKYSNLLKDDCQRFDIVRDLTLCYEARKEKCEDYFSNVRTLRLKMNLKQDEKQILGLEYIQSLRIIINFYYLKHLDISAYCAIETSSLIEICKQASKLSSITINPWILSILLNDYELCECLNKMIKKLNVYKCGQNSFKNSDEVEQFCQRFSNVEQLICEIDQLNQLLILLNQTSKLSMITVFLTSSDNLEELLIWFKNETLKFNLIYRINYFHTYTDGISELYKTQLSIWTDGKRAN